MQIKRSDNPEINIWDKIYIKDFKAGKLDAQFMGPYEINQIDKKGQWIKILGLKD
jgi:hypothetical protein